MARLFVAIDVSEEVDRYLKELQTKLREIGVKPFKFTKEFHLTLLFIGDTEESKIDKIKDYLDSIDFDEFRLHLTEAGVFPDKKNIKVVWAGLDKKKDLMRLQDDIGSRLSFLNLKSDNRFHPHLTLARVRFLEQEDKDALIKFLGTSIDQIGFSVSSFRLYKSVLTPEGPVYELVHTIQCS